MKTFFLSLKTTVWTLFALVCFFFVGAYMMPIYRETFSPMNDGLLFEWVEQVATGNLRRTGWFFASLAGLVLLTINTLACGIQALTARWSRTAFLIRISPQIIHAGFLFILLAHLLGAGWGYKLNGMMPEGAFARLPEGRGLRIGKILVQADAGHLKDWAVSVSVYENDRVVKSGILGPNRPLFYGGAGIYLKNISFGREPAAMLLVAKDPGAVWALLGGLLFMLGSFTLLVLKWKRV